MRELGFYTVEEAYVEHLAPLAPHLFRNARPEARHSRKFIGVVLEVNGFDYFAPLSSFKPKHAKMKNGLDFLKVGDYAVINLNCMFPVPDGCCERVDFSKEGDLRYRSLLVAEYGIVRKMQGKIRRNAANLYRHKIENGSSTALAARCNDFAALEKACLDYAG